MVEMNLVRFLRKSQKCKKFQTYPIPNYNILDKLQRDFSPIARRS